MFEAKLKSRSQPKLGALAVTFPIPEERYENVILALQNLQIGDVRKQDCCIESIRAPDCPALLRMTNTMANVDELDWLGKQLESFDRYELLQFNAAVERFGLSAADELIDLSFCAREVTVISDFTDLEKTGKRHYLTVHGACDPKELENLDGKDSNTIILVRIIGPHQPIAIRAANDGRRLHIILIITLNTKFIVPNRICTGCGIISDFNSAKLRRCSTRRVFLPDVIDPQFIAGFIVNKISITVMCICGFMLDTCQRIR